MQAQGHLFKLKILVEGFLNLLSEKSVLKIDLYRRYWKKRLTYELTEIEELDGIRINNNAFAEFPLALQQFAWDIWPIEAFWLVKLLQRSGAQRILELGTFTGLMTLYFSKYSNENAIVTTVDLPEEEFDKIKPDKNVFLGMRYKRTDYEKKIKEIRTDIYQIGLPGLERQGFIFIDITSNYVTLNQVTRLALSLLSFGGTVVWRNYDAGRSVDAVRYLNELRREIPGLRHIKGTSLVFYQAPT